MTIAFFDFDGTISNKDSFSLFLRMTCSSIQYRFRKYLLGLPLIFGYKLGLINTFSLKKARIKQFVSHLTSTAYHQIQLEFNQKILPQIIKQSALERIKWHQQQGHEVWVVSASFDFCLQQWCTQQHLGLITNTTLKQVDGVPIRVISELDCNGTEKVRRISELIDISKYKEIFAYGDTIGDQPMLKKATKPHYQYFN